MNIMPKLRIGLAIPTLLWLFNSCTTTGINSIFIDKGGAQTQWIINNRILGSYIEIKEIKFRKDDEILKLYIQFYNKKNSPIGTEIKVEYFDKDGFPFDNLWGWQPIMLEPKQTEWLKFIAPIAEEQIGKVKIMMQKVTKNE